VDIRPADDDLRQAMLLAKSGEGLRGAIQKDQRSIELHDLAAERRFQEIDGRREVRIGAAGLLDRAREGKRLAGRRKISVNPESVAFDSERIGFQVS